MKVIIAVDLDKDMFRGELFMSNEQLLAHLLHITIKRLDNGELIDRLYSDPVRDSNRRVVLRVLKGD